VEELLDDLDRWRREELRVAIARVVEIDDPDRVASSVAMAVNERGEVVGSVRCGCSEGAVVAAALEVLRHGRPRLVSLGHSGDQAFSVGLAAGGTVHVLLEPLDW
jgi:xanthine/CO dehydrogenase XdhC/CoxF family maturation factor